MEYGLSIHLVCHKQVARTGRLQSKPHKHIRIHRSGTGDKVNAIEPGTHGTQLKGRTPPDEARKGKATERTIRKYHIKFY